MEPLRILYEDEHLVVCIKPRGVLSQPSPTEREGDMLSLLREQLHLADVKPIHRLDRGVGGVMVFAKTAAAAGKLSCAVADHSLQKEYLAVIHGAPDPSDGEMTDLLYHDAAKNRSFVVDRKRAGVKQARLLYHMVKAFPGPDGEPLSLVRVLLLTGRTHQIRVQFSSRKMPLVGDGKYGGRDPFPIALWSYRLCFPHPCRRGKIIDIAAPPHDHPVFSTAVVPEQDAPEMLADFT